MPLPVIERIATPRLVLRPVAAGDLPDLLEVNGDPEVTRFLPYAAWRSLDDAAGWLDRMDTLAAAGDARQLVLVRAADAHAIGTLLLFRHDAASARAELGYVLGRSHWGRGLMREALQAACAHAFGALGLRRLEAEVHPDNAASWRLLERLGFMHEGTLRQRWVAQGAPYDTRLYGRLASDRIGPADDPREARCT